MTPWLKRRLCVLIGASLLVSGATYLHAQSDYPAPAKTPEEAAINFYQLLDSVHNNTGSFYDESNLAVNTAVGDYSQNEAVDFAGHSAPVLALKDGSISRVQFESFNTSTYQFRQLLDLLFQRAHAPQYDGRITGSSDSQTLVEVTPATQPKGRDVVVIAEDGGYRVDLKTTFAHWNNVSGHRLDEVWFSYTGAASSALSNSGNFLRSRCQSQLKQQMLGIIQYTQDWDEKLPPAREWIDAVQPYVKLEPIFKCPSMPKGGNGYAFNQYLSHFPLMNMNSPATTINVYETSNPRRNWFGPGTGRAYRHQGGWNLGFADGHVKWYPEGKPTDMQFKPLITVAPPLMPGAPGVGTPPSVPGAPTP